MGTELEDVLGEASDCSDFGRLQSLGRKLERQVHDGGYPPDHAPLTVALLGGASTDFIERPLALLLAARGYAPEIHAAPYGVYMPEMIDPDSATSRLSPRLAVVVTTPFDIPEWPEEAADAMRADEVARRVCRHLLDACSTLHERCGTEIVLNNFHPLPARPWGNFGVKVPEDPNNFIRRVNLLLGDLAPPFVHINDVAGLAMRHGLDHWFDLRLWHEAKQPVAPERLADYVRNTASVIAGVMGKSRKCLVVDLDNTLWGGVVGDDGLDGIDIGEGGARGEAFKVWQRYLKQLRARGVLLAVCSKNDEARAEEPFREHPEMVLRRDDFVAFAANWEPKSSNIEAIARELDLGLDSFVFVDDNPAERWEVRQALPEVAVPEVDGDPCAWPAVIEDAGYFEIAAVTGEDRRRSALYRGRRERRRLQSSSRDLGEFLRSLRMTAVIRPFEPVAMTRITQLVNKTNQFNLTAQRLTRGEIEAYAADPGRLTRSVRLADRFGDHGLIAVAMARVDGCALRIDGWLMSCRVLKRGVEQVMMNELAAAARDRGLTQIHGHFAPTGRNELVRRLFPDLGFHPRAEAGGGLSFVLDLEGFRPFDTFIEIEEGVRS